jgi:hypothetical protein
MRADLGWAAKPAAGVQDEATFTDIFSDPATVARWATAQQKTEVKIDPLFIDLIVR